MKLENKKRVAAGVLSIKGFNAPLFQERGFRGSIDP